MSRGTLFLVVGASGSGKDTLLEGAGTALGDDPCYLFVHRVITRPADAGGEVHEAVTEAEFESRKQAGELMLAWGAHGLRYGIPASVDSALADGRHAIVNVSRSTIQEARERFPPVKVISIVVPNEVLRGRLETRGREDTADIERRLTRAAAFIVEGGDVVELVNDGPVEDGVQAFLQTIGADEPV